MEKRLRAIPLGRVAEPEEMANVAVFLASERSSFIIGQTILVDGGEIDYSAEMVEWARVRGAQIAKK